MSRSFSMSPWSKNSSATFFASWCCSSHGLAMADTSQAVINMPQRTAEKREMLLRLFPHVTFSSKTPQPTDACTQGLCVWYVHVRTLRLIPLHYKVLFFCWSSHNWIIPILFSGAYIVLIVGSTLLTYSHLLISLMCMCVSMPAPLGHMFGYFGIHFKMCATLSPTLDFLQSLPLPT